MGGFPNSLPQSGLDVTNSSGNVANATCTATIPAAPNRVSYVTGFEFTYSGATAAGVVVATLSGILNGPLTYIVPVPIGVAVGGVPLIVEFSRPIPGSAINQGISFSVPALGAGNTNAAAAIHGFQGEVASE